MSSAPAGTRWFGARVEVPPGVTRARLVTNADDGYTAYVNGVQVAHADADGAENWRRPALTDVTARLGSGTAVLAVAATNASESPAGLLVALELTSADGTVRSVPAGADWRADDKEPPGSWTAPEFDDDAWSAAKVLAVWGSGPWGEVTPAHAPAEVWIPVAEGGADQVAHGTAKFLRTEDGCAVFAASPGRHEFAT
ncbi:hypothetical protein C1I97_28445 [Streptomyces sp. NTH33]|uniref:hypothetical protein n=1 Tax=Streptomyces sp. NTH33 TaxID=1735453 RepID=UPI000DA7430C|nr:hypothetical protein C1I97_28445 [Streptomyces sp. NTH33]